MRYINQTQEMMEVMESFYKDRKGKIVEEITKKYIEEASDKIRIELANEADKIHFTCRRSPEKFGEVSLTLEFNITETQKDSSDPK